MRINMCKCLYLHSYTHYVWMCIASSMSCGVVVAQVFVRVVSCRIVPMCCALLFVEQGNCRMILRDPRTVHLVKLRMGKNNSPHVNLSKPLFVYHIQGSWGCFVLCYGVVLLCIPTVFPIEQFPAAPNRTSRLTAVDIRRSQNHG